MDIQLLLTYFSAEFSENVYEQTLIVLVDGRATVDEPCMVRGEPTVNEYDL